jgi:predicted dehydrogenase
MKRRNFIKASAVTSAAGFTILPSCAVSTAAPMKKVAPSDKVNLACCGIGHRGGAITMALFETGMANMVAFCDVDMEGEHTAEVLAKFPDVPRFTDFREMFDKMGDKIDAVSVGTPDFSHFPITMLAMSMGIHVYVEKPMARTFQEVELMMQGAKKHGVVTQMGNQGHSEANYFQFKAWKDAGVIKDITSVVAHMNNRRRWHSWDPKMMGYPAKEALPTNMNWDTWLMTAKHHDYNKDYHHGQWRCWYDFGMGALGDWGAHTMDTAHEFLELGLPEEVTPEYLEGHNPFFFPMSTTLKFKFPKRGNMPAVDLMWYDGLTNQPPLPEGYGESKLDPNIPPPSAGAIKKSKLNPGKIIYGKDLTFKGGSHGSTLDIVGLEASNDMASSLPEVPVSPSNHFENFLKSCRGEEKCRSSFEIAGPLSQVFALGVMAQRLNTKLVFDRTTKRITNNPLADLMLEGGPPRKGWEEYYTL